MEKHATDTHTSPRTIGRLLLDSGKLNPSDADKIVQTQQQFNLRFGDAALKLGLITEDDILQVVSQQFDYDCLLPDDDSIDHTVITAFQAYGKEVEAFRALRSQLSLRWFAENDSLVVSAARPNSGTSYIAANLAVMFAQLGQKTLLIDANMRAPNQQDYFKISSKTGLSDVLAKRAGLDVIHSVTGLNNLSVLFAGTVPPNPLELIGHGRFSILHQELSSKYEVIIIDTPPMLEFSDAQAVLSVSKGGVIVARKNESEISDIDAVKQHMIVAGVEPLGVVLNNYK
ncbi:MAG: chain length determinant protein tyrosine kinase EpsG [Pseudomonadota bacterium]|nr:chain length determinant protein tyrosine kinase EpsG [Pseudomonadota bacterium]